MGAQRATLGLRGGGELPLAPPLRVDTQPAALLSLKKENNFFCFFSLIYLYFFY